MKQAGAVVHLGVDVGTSNTAAALHLFDGTVRPVLFDGAPSMPSAVFADPDGFVVGTDAYLAGLARPAHLEPHPKQRIDDGHVLLGDREVPVETLISAVLRRVVDAALPLSGGEPPTAVTLTCPVVWGSRRLATLREAARLAGLPPPDTRAEPVAAAAYFVHERRLDLAEGAAALVYDLGAGTFDATLIRRTCDGFDVVGSVGLLDAGGLDIDAAIVAMISATVEPGHAAWRRLHHPATPADVRARRLLWDAVRAAKEMLSRAGSTIVYVPLLEREVPLGREQLESLAWPTVERTVRFTRALLRDADLTERDLAAVLLVGGASRTPLVGTALHRALRIAPLTVDQPELVVAQGSVVPLTPATQVPDIPNIPAAGPVLATLGDRPAQPAADEAKHAATDTATDDGAARLPTGRRRRVVVLVAAVSILAFIGSWTAFAVADPPVFGRSTMARAVGSAPPTGPAGDLIAGYGEVADCTLISRDPAARGTFHGFRLNSISFRWQSRDSRYLDRVPALRRTTDGSSPNEWHLTGLGAPPTAEDSTTLVSGHPVPLEDAMPGRQVAFTYTLDPDNLIPETDETNNTVMVTVSVPPDANDVQPDRAVPCTHG